MKIKIEEGNNSHTIEINKVNGLYNINILPCWTFTNELEYDLSDYVYDFITKVKGIPFKKNYTLSTPNVKIAKKRNLEVMFGRGCGLYFSNLYIQDKDLAEEILLHISKYNTNKEYKEISEDDYIKRMAIFKKLGYK